MQRQALNTTLSPPPNHSLSHPLYSPECEGHRLDVKPPQVVVRRRQKRIHPRLRRHRAQPRERPQRARGLLRAELAQPRLRRGVEGGEPRRVDGLVLCVYCVWIAIV